MKVRIFVGASRAYACIETETRNMDIQLASGKSAEKSLREYAAEERARALKILQRAEVAEAAANHLENNKEQ